ncbi:hypothetical protein [Streptomyces sp. NBC_01244]|uniref:hypothetical protein n=1 Tax=Streptomyces sp. NBC_01244 TaxID=2903797 RepID=UPI002E1537D1|nr:hypothetical protein OG247_25215 [Streptomyces sp. NBC_01244]
MDIVTCTQCSATGLEKGLLDDITSPSGFTRWVEGAMPTGAFSRKGKKRYRVEAARCPRCGHLELFATQPSG